MEISPVNDVIKCSDRVGIDFDAILEELTPSKYEIPVKLLLKQAGAELCHAPLLLPTYSPLTPHLLTYSHSPFTHRFEDFPGGVGLRKSW